MRKKVVIATRNPKKLSEIRALIGASLDVICVSDLEPPVAEIEEDQPDFEGNAGKKALEVAKASGFLTIADDSGLEVDCLGGEPGVRSARFSGDNATAEENNALLLERMREVPKGSRSARFRCVVAIAEPAGIVETFHGACEGVITDVPRGSKGFGYDPLFLLPEKGLTFAEIPPEEKNRISHRARAFEKVADFLSHLP